jgi:predicted nucleic acid-binding protein
VFANRFTAFVDACVLADTLRRNLLLTLAEADFFRIHWSSAVLDETQAAIEKIRNKKGLKDASVKAEKARSAMETAFEDAIVSGYEQLVGIGHNLPDRKDAHVLAAALKAQSAIIITENLKDFPSNILSTLNMEARSADVFLADTISLDPARAVAAIKRMRERLKNPKMTPGQLLLEMEARGLTEVVDVLKPYLKLL